MVYTFIFFKDIFNFIRVLYMHYFWAICTALAVLLTICTYVVTIREIFSTLEYGGMNSLDIQYHETEEQIREQENHKINVIYVKGVNGLPVGIKMESTQSFPTYYTPGTFAHGAATYVPTYEDSILLPLAKEKIT